MRILIAEDNEALTEGLDYCLRRAGHQVELAADGQLALEALATDRFDLLVLDFGLPRVHGSEVLRQVRSRADHLPVLLCSALGDANQQVSELGLAVDDFLPKPFGLSEFERRVADLARRIVPQPNRQLSFGPLRHDLGSDEICSGGHPLELSPDERCLLRLLMEEAELPASLDQVARRLQGIGACTTTPCIESCMTRLREQLSAHGVGIAKVRGLGFCLIQL